MKIIRQHKQPSLLIILFYAILACGLMAPIATNYFIPNLADFINHLAALIQAKQGLDEGQFPLRVSPLALSGYRYPYFQFYSPTLFLFAGAVYKWLCPDNPLLAMRLVMWLGLTLAGFYMYRLANWFFKSWQIALLAGVVYLTAPYYLIILDHLGNLPETWALGLIPIVIYYCFRRFYYPDNPWILLKGALAWYLLMTIHLATAIYTTMLVFTWLLILTLTNNRLLRPLISTIIMYALAALLAMWYLAPAAIYAHLMLVSSTFVNADNFVFFSPILSQLLSPSALLTLQSKSALVSIHPSLGWPLLFALCLSVYLLGKKIKVMNAQVDQSMRILTLLCVLVFIMAWSPINFWNYMPSIFLIGQYSWRLLGQVIWMAALLFAWGLVWLTKEKLDLPWLITLIALTVAMTSSWLPHHENYQQDINQFKKNPLFVYNDTAYALDFNSNTNLVDAIDRLLLYSLIKGNQLILNKNYVFPATLLTLSDRPTVVMEADISNDLAKKNIILQAIVNNKIIASYPLHKEHMRWVFELTQAKDKDASLKFVAKTQTPGELFIPMQKLMLSGFLPSNSLMQVNEVKKYCQNEGQEIVCRLKDTKEATVIELPVFYYPQLMTVSINDKNAIFHSIIRENELLTTVTAESAKETKITIRFTGLVWANWVSCGAWGLWLILFSYCYYHSLRMRKMR